jgi:hypothetical protein
MLAIDRTTEATIPATKTRKDRRVVHTPNTTGEGPHSGTVTVTEHTGVRVKRILQDTYQIDEQFHAGAGRVFLILKDHVNGSNADTVKGQADAERVGNVYECWAHGEFGSCTCDGFVASCGKNKCVHLLAMQALIAAGLPEPQASFPSEVWPSVGQMADDGWTPSDDDTAEIEIEPYRDDADAEPAPEPGAVIETPAEMPAWMKKAIADY